MRTNALPRPCPWVHAVGRERWPKRKIVQGYTEAHTASMRILDDSGAAVKVKGDPWSELLAWRLAVKYLAAVYRGHPLYDPTWED